MDAGQAKPADAHRMAVHSPVILIKKKVGRAGTKKTYYEDQAPTTPYLVCLHSLTVFTL